MAMFKYGNGSRNLIDATTMFCAANFYPRLTEDLTGGLNSEAQKWGREHSIMTAYHTWQTMTSMDRITLNYSPQFQTIALNCLDLLTSLGLDKPSLLAETFDLFLERSQNDDADFNVEQLDWLWQLGVPSYPALAFCKTDKELEDARELSWFKLHAYKVQGLSWCGIAAKYGSIKTLMGLESLGVGASDRIRLYEGLAQKIGKHSSAISIFKESHPWVAICSLSPHKEKYFLPQAQDLAQIWRPARQDDLSVAIDALAYRSWDEKSSYGMSVLIAEAQPISASVLALIESSVWTLLSLSNATPLGYPAQQEAFQFLEKATQWMHQCHGPTSEKLLLDLSQRVQLSVKKMTDPDQPFNKYKICSPFEELKSFLTLLPWLGDWGKVGSPVLFQVITDFTALVAALPDRYLNHQPIKKLIDDIYQSLEFLDPELRLNTHGPKRI